MAIFTAKYFETDVLLQIAPRVLEILLVLFLAWSVAGLFTDYIPVGQKSLAGEKERVLNPRVDTTTMENSAVFGQYQDSTVIAPAPQIKDAVSKPAVESRRPIKLKGTVVADKDSAAFVLVGGSRKVEVFHLGDTIQAGVTLEKVEANRILIKAKGMLETVMLVMPGKGKNISGKISVPGRKVPAVAARSGSGVLSRSVIDGAINNLPKLMTQAQVLPHFQNGKSDGFVISRIAPGSLYADIGLKNNDIIKSVNGVSITSPDQAMSIYNSLRRASHLELMVKRHGQLQTLQLDIR